MTFKMCYSLTQRLWRYLFIGFCTLVFTYLIAPILVIIPLSFNEDPFFSYPITRFSLRWYNDIFGSDPQAILWQRAFVNSAFIGICSTVIATVLGTAAALGLNRTAVAFRSSIVALMISPMIIPVIIAAIGMFYFYAQIGLVGTFTGIILAHASLGVPFVLITVSATLVGLDGNLVRAGASLGASPFRVFRKVTLPLILPGVASGALFAFVTSWDEVVVTLFLSGAEQHTIPRRMWSGVRDNLSPTIIAVATMLIVLSMALMLSAEWLRGRSERLRLGGS
jgi:putative spermidine/putrescine transport system permease protein